MEKPMQTFRFPVVVTSRGHPQIDALLTKDSSVRLLVEGGYWGLEMTLCRTVPAPLTLWNRLILTVVLGAEMLRHLGTFSPSGSLLLPDVNIPSR